MLSRSDPRDSSEAADSGQASWCPRHEALLYSGDGGFLDGTLPFIKDALAEQEPILVAVGAQRVALLRQALGADARRVRFMDMARLGRNPARIIPAWHRFREHAASAERGVRSIGEPIWPGRGPAELAECERHEALLNVALAHDPRWRLLCPYDLDGLDEHVIEGALRSHPFIAGDGASRPSDSYVGVPAMGPFDGMLEPPPGRASELSFTGEDLRTLRRHVADWAEGSRLDAERAEHLVLAVNELATNSVRYGGGRGRVRMWRDKDALLVEVDDRGRFSEPLVGRIPPAPDQHAGRGLWLVNQLCDLVQIRSTADGSVVRLHMRM